MKMVCLHEGESPPAIDEAKCPDCLFSRASLLVAIYCLGRILLLCEC